jgi:hypothetical protein
MEKLCSFEGSPGLAQFPVAFAWGKHLFPFRTEQLSPTAPMVLGSQGPGRVGRRRFLQHEPPTGRLVLVNRLRERRPPSGSHDALAEGRRVVLAAPKRASTHSGRRMSGDPRGDEDRRPGEGAWPAGAPVLPDRAPSGRQARLMARRSTGVRQACTRAGTLPPLRGVRRRGIRLRCGWAAVGAVDRCACAAAGRGAGCRAGAGSSVASPSVANSSAVPMAPRTSSRSERLFGRRVVVSGNMCS